jgi:hypothetical protein
MCWIILKFKLNLKWQAIFYTSFKWRQPPLERWKYVLKVISMWLKSSLGEIRWELREISSVALLSLASLHTFLRTCLQTYLHKCLNTCKHMLELMLYKNYIHFYTHTSTIYSKSCPNQTPILSTLQQHFITIQLKSQSSFTFKVIIASQERNFVLVHLTGQYQICLIF